MKELSIKNILVPVDFSDMSIRAIEAAKNLARRFGSTIHLVNIQEPIYPAMYFGPGAAVPASSFDTGEELRQSASRRINSLAKENRLTGICDSIIGAPVFSELCAIAKQIPADLVVTPTHGRTGLKHVILGSTAERLVQHSPCPVLVLRERKGRRRSRGKSRSTIDTILVPVDFSRCSLDGLNYAIRLAKKFAAKILVLHVVDFGPAVTADGFGMYHLNRYREIAEAQAERDMRRFLRSVKFGSVKYWSQIITGAPANGICSVATKEDVDLIVTATHGRTGFKHLLIGSTAEVVVRHAPCSVLVVPSHPKERAKRTAGRGKSLRKIQRNDRSAGSRRPIDSENFTKRFRKIKAHAFPERRKTNKFRETHLLH